MTPAEAQAIRSAVERVDDAAYQRATVLHLGVFHDGRYTAARDEYDTARAALDALLDGMVQR